MTEGMHVGHERVSSVVGQDKAEDMQAFMERHDLGAMIIISRDEAMLLGNETYSFNPAPFPMILRDLAAQIEASMAPVSEEVH